MAESLIHQEARELVGDLGRSMVEQELTRGTGGNVSVRRDDRIAISPSGVPYEDVTAESVPLVDLDGERVAGDLKPSNETPMHTIIYRKRSDIGGIVHTHSPYASTFASLNTPILASHYLIGYIGSEIPVAGYESPGTAELGEAAADVMGEEYNAVLLKNHGVIAVGEDGEDALEIALMVEYCARIHHQALAVGEPEILPDETVDDLQRMFRDEYGQ